MRRTRLPVAAAVVVITVAACGDGASSAAPSGVRSALSQVDAAVRAHDYGGARTDLDALIARTIAARDQAQMSASQAKDILAAAAQLRADLPQPAPNPSPAANPSPAVQPTQPGPGKGGDKKDGRGDGGGDNGHNGRKGPGHGHGK
jgi:hypothetical protein